MESDGTRKRTGGEVRGKDANGEGSQHSSACASSGYYQQQKHATLWLAVYYVVN